LVCEHDLGNMCCDKSADFDRNIADPCWDGDPSEYRNLRPVHRGTTLESQANHEICRDGVWNEGDIASTILESKVIRPSNPYLEVGVRGTASSSHRCAIQHHTSLGSRWCLESSFVRTVLADLSRLSTPVAVRGSAVVSDLLVTADCQHEVLTVQSDSFGLMLGMIQPYSSRRGMPQMH